MNKLRYLPLAILSLLVYTSLHAQPAQYIIDMEEFQVPEEVMWEVEADQDLEDSERAAFFASLPEDEYLKAAKTLGQLIEFSKTTIYVDGNNFAAETIELQGKMTMIYKDGLIYLVMWDKKKVIKTSKEDIEKARENAVGMMGKMQQNMPDMDAIMKSMPKDQQDKFKDAMKQLQKGKGMQPEVSQEEPVVEKTGKKRTVLNTTAELYLAKTDQRTEGIWAIDNKALAQTYEKMAKEMQTASGMKDAGDIEEWKIAPGKFPAVTTTYEQSMLGRAFIGVQRCTRIQNAPPPKIKFVPPGKEQGFSEGSLSDTMGDINDPKR